MMRSTGILSVCLSVGTFTFRIYSWSNSTITHAQNLCAIFFSHVVCTCSYYSTIIVRVRVGVRRVRGAWVAFENKNKPVSPPIVVAIYVYCNAQARPMMISLVILILQLSVCLSVRP